MNQTTLPRMNNKDIGWISTLFGTAIGAGILYLPIQAGMSGFSALLFVSIIALPLSYYSHRNMARSVIGDTQGRNITEIFNTNLGMTLGVIFTVVYFLAIYLNMPLYAIALNHEFANFFLSQHWVSTDLSVSPWFSFMILLVLVAVMMLGESIILKVMEALVLPLIIMVAITAFVIMPYWNTSFILSGDAWSFMLFLKGVLMLLPILVLAMNHSPVISSLVMFYKKHLKAPYQAENRVYRILKVNAVVLFVFVIFFVFSTILSSSPEQIQAGYEQNLSIITIIQQNINNPLITILAPFIVFTAIISSFVGCFIGSREGLNSLLYSLFNRLFKLNVSKKWIDSMSVFLIFITLWSAAIFNFKIVAVIGVIVAPCVACLLYILPVVIIYRNICYQQYRNAFLNSILVIVGTVIIFGYVLGQMV